MSDFIEVFHSPKLHAACFTYKERRYSFSGWWILDWGDGDKFYDTIDDFLCDPFFDGKTLAEIQDVITDVDYELEP